MVGIGRAQAPRLDWRLGRPRAPRARRPSGRGSSFLRSLLALVIWPAREKGVSADSEAPAEAREGRERGLEGAAGEGASRAHEALELYRQTLRELLDGEVGAQVVRDRVEAAAVDDPGAALYGLLVVAHVHQVDELGLAGQVNA